jgi:CheY-like chemotaxis protein
VNEHDDVSVFLGPSDLEQALINVLLNARDAVLASSRTEKVVTISTSRFVGRPSDGQRSCLNEGTFAKIEIADTGSGMTDAVRARVFEPFFTTKEVGCGTGLGLAMVYAVVTQAGGCALCHSHIGRGTQVVLYLPETKAAAVAVPSAPTTSELSLGKRLILVVEDEETVAEATLAVLRKSGMEAHRAAGLAEALELARSHPEAHLVLLDRSMPGGPADKIVGDLRRLLPKARIVFFTGEDLSPQEAQQVDAVLLKPMAARALLAFVTSIVP